MKKEKVVVKQDPNSEEVIERTVLAQAIKEISRSMQQLQKQGIKRNAIELLTANLCQPVGSRFNRKKPTRKEVRSVFNALAELEREYCK